MTNDMGDWADEILEKWETEEEVEEGDNYNFLNMEYDFELYNND